MVTWELRENIREIIISLDKTNYWSAKFEGANSSSQQADLSISPHEIDLI